MNKSTGPVIRVNSHKSNHSAEKQPSFSQHLPNKTLLENQSPSKEELLENKLTFKQIKNRAKISIIDFSKTHLKTNSTNQVLATCLSQVQGSSSIHKLFEKLFHSVELLLQPQEKEVIVTVKTKQAAKIRLVREEEKKRTKTSKQVEQLEKANEDLKKQLFLLKEQKNGLQKRIVGLIEEFKTRKSFYLAEIKKLADIINSSPIDIRTLILTKTKQAKNLEQKQEREKKQKNYHLRTEALIGIYDQKRFASDKKQESRVNYSAQVKPLRDVTSIQHLEQQK